MDTLTVIAAVPWDSERADNARRLADETGGVIVWDRTRNAYETFLACLLMAGREPTIHLEDDVDLCPRWRERIEEAIAARPEDLIQFFSIRPSDVGKPSHYRPGRDFMNNQCWYAPARMAEPLAEAVAASKYRGMPKAPYDSALHDFLGDRRERYWQHLPSLVQHLPWKSRINPRRPAHRQSLTYGR